jgi:hypothetical protein
VEAFASLGKMVALIGQPDLGDDTEAGTGSSKTWRVKGANSELGGGNMDVANAEWSMAALWVRSPGVHASSMTKPDAASL